MAAAAQGNALGKVSNELANNYQLPAHLWDTIHSLFLHPGVATHWTKLTNPRRAPAEHHQPFAGQDRKLEAPLFVCIPMCMRTL